MPSVCMRGKLSDYTKNGAYIILYYIITLLYLSPWKYLCFIASVVSGPRMCPGKHLAKCQIFLYLTSTLTRFKFELGQDERPTLKNSIKFVIVPEKNYLVKLIERV